jgi:uncharacterized protein
MAIKTAARTVAADAPMVAAIAALALVSGVLIGCIGIGGVFLVPCLSLAGVDVHAAIGASMFSFIFSGAIGVWLYARHGSIAWRSATWLAAGAAPAAFLGALLAAHTRGDILLLLVGATVTFAGWRMLRRASKPESPDVRFAPLLLAGVGAAVGRGSALTGTGGPVLLVPLLMWLGAPVLTAVGLSQAIQVPIALMASLGNFWTGSLELLLAAVLSIGVTFGSAVGARIAHAVPAHFLSRLVAVALVLVGAMVAVQSGHTLARQW